MLVISRKLHEKVLLPAIGTAVQVMGIKRGVVRLGIEAPQEVTVLRAEVADRVAEWGRSDSRTQERTAAEGMRDQRTGPLQERLQTTGVSLGLLRLQLEAGQIADAKATLAALQQDYQVLLHGVHGETESPLRQCPSQAHRRQKALLVEDDRNERELLAGFLRQAGLEVDTAGDGSDALDYLRTHAKPDMVLLDMGLPRVDGPTTVRSIRHNPALSGLKVFGVTGHSPDEFDLERGPAGIDRWFQKPLDPARLLRDLHEELDGALCAV
jgi:carbon storage regulator CsrA